MIMHISYREGYADALRDVFSWFDNHQHWFPKRSRELILIILQYFINKQDRLFMEKECFEFDVSIPVDKKMPVTVKPELSDRQSRRI